MKIVDLATASQRAEALCKENGLEILEQKDIPYGRQFKVRAGGTTAQLNVYFGKKGLKLVVQGGGGEAKSALESVTAAMEGRSAGSAASTSAPAKKDKKPLPDVEFAYEEPWIGTDESGKGDFFGGLVTAGVIVDPEAVPLLQSLGVDDSKKINDAKIQSMSTEIRKICYGKYKILSLVPSKYNDLYERMKGEGKNLNSLLAWAHVSVLESLLEIQYVKLAIADKFADEKYINTRLKKLGRTIELIQVPKAEQNIAVAAASILARDAFLRWHQDAKKQHGVTFPKGANAQVVQVGRTYVQSNGKEALRNVAKLHFKTTEEVFMYND
ncbi:ribonuclease HIII [Tumebacillus flagellatus]|uniref:Ribonuclease n=1 Tax=Tumebacillus flagellatus TaxID=1157490 RepID=A0A074LTU4_9BACL|nr:ribonuclease HIII [Tumebacillus flagellatus]KEO84564.1 hypothetical protein EL26_03335 [Tumebacillus flagellatus]